MLATATADDYVAMTGMPEPAEWFGLASRRPWLVEGIGVVYRAADGRWWLSFQRAPGVHKVKTAHAAAKRLLAEADGRGLVLHALADPRIDGAEAWIERLGFRRSGEKMEGLDVWTR